MKKLISIILSLALVACMFAMNVGAELVVGDKDSDKALSAGDGWTDTEFDSNKSATADVMLALGAVESRYAVDIVFTGNFNLTAAGLTWDVNNLVYVTTGDTVANQTYTFVVTNYSDKYVNVTTAASDVVDGVTATFGTVTPGAAGDTDNVAADNKSCTIVGNAGGDATANKATFSATLASTNWAGTINTLVGNDPTKTSFKLATFTVTISKS